MNAQLRNTTKGPIFLTGKEGLSSDNSPVVYIKGNKFLRKYSCGLDVEVLNLGTPQEQEVPYSDRKV